MSERETAVTHDDTPGGDNPCGGGEHYVTVSRTITITEHFIVDVPGGTAPNEHARAIVGDIEDTVAPDEWVRDTDTPRVLSYHTEIGDY